MLLIVHFFISLVVNGTTPNFEQLAADHFFNNIIVERYPELKVVEMATKTDTSMQNGIIMHYKEWNEGIRKRTYSQPSDDQVELKNPESRIKVKKLRKMSNRLKVYVSTKKKVGDYYFVKLSAYKRLEFVDHFIFQFDQLGRLIDICVKSEII